MANRQDNAYISVSITDRTGLLPLGRWEDRSGGQSDSASTTYAKAGIGGRSALGGRQEVANVTVKRLYDAEMQAQVARLRKGVGKATMQVSEQGTNDENEVDPAAPLETWKGILKSVHIADRSTEANAAQTIELEMVVDGEVVVT